MQNSQLAEQTKQSTAAVQVNKQENLFYTVQIYPSLAEDTFTLDRLIEKFKALETIFLEDGYKMKNLKELATTREEVYKIISYLSGDYGDIAILLYAIKKGGNEEHDYLRRDLLPGSILKNEQIAEIDKFLCFLIKIAGNFSYKDFPIIDVSVEVVASK